VVMIFVGALVARRCGEAMGCHAGAEPSVNFVHVQYPHYPYIISYYKTSSPLTPTGLNPIIMI